MPPAPVTAATRYEPVPLWAKIPHGLWLREATSVAIKRWSLPERKAPRICSRLFCATSEWSAAFARPALQIAVVRNRASMSFTRAPLLLPFEEACQLRSQDRGEVDA